MDFYKIIMQRKTAFLKYLLVCLFFVLPIVIANVYYIDDLGRATFGYTGWGRDGRPMADVIMITLNLGRKLTDLAPLPLLLAAAILAWCFYRFKRLYFGHDDIWSFLVPIAFICNPYFVEVLSYRFDSLTIVGGIAFCFMVLVTRHFKRIKRNVLACLAMLAAISSYQILLNVLAALLLIEFICMVAWSRPAQVILTLTGERLVQLAAALALYFGAVLPIALHKQQVENHPGLASGNMADVFLFNAQSYTGFIRASLFGEATWFIIAALTVIMLLAVTVLAVAYIKTNGTGRKECFIAASCAISPFLALFLVLGALLFLKNPIAAFSRVYLGFSGYLLFFSTSVYLAAEKIRCRRLNFILWLPILYAVPFIYAYGNALRQQDVLDHDLVQSLKRNTSEFKEGEYYLVFNGERRLSPVVRNAAEKYPLINTLVINYFSNWYYPFRYMQVNGLTQLYPEPAMGITDNPRQRICQSELVKKEGDYNLYRKGNILTVDFSKYVCP